MNRALLRVDGLGVTLSGRAVLEDVSLSFSSRHLVALVGPNGAGKTTLLKLLTGELAPDSGTVSVAKSLSGIVTPLDNATESTTSG